ncbi:MAG: AAA family ATPase [Fimbriimonadales bacterium]|nr:MAG: hypothetical protein KatS3mg018_0165 [Fimbriimonadales bacterium]
MTPRNRPQPPTLDAIIPHLRVKRVSKRNGTRHVQAHCPCHDDRNPSLSITEKPDGTLLVKCFAGCEQEALWRELCRLAGVEPARGVPVLPTPRPRAHAARNGSTPAPAESSRERLTVHDYAHAKGLDAERLPEWGLRECERGVAIPYLDADGNHVATRYRHALEGENRFSWARGNRPCMYGLWNLPLWDDSETVYLCEGETDALTLWHAGLPALGIPGASVWREAWWEPLKRFARICIIPDADEAGRQLVEKLAHTCPLELQERVEVLELPEGVKDANELYLQLDADAERFREAVLLQSATPLRDCNIALLHYSDGDDLQLLAPLRELLQNDASEPIEYLPLLGTDGLIARGTITLLGAHPKAGKTTLLIHACREWLRLGLKVVYLSEDPQPVWRLRVGQFPELAELILNAIPRAHPERWAQAIEATQPDLVIVDTIRRFLPARDENDSASVSTALAPFIDLAQRLPRTAIVLVHHTKKNLSPEGEITDIAGSHAFTAEVDAILLLAPVREHNRQRLLTPIAGRLWTLSPEPLVLELSEDGSAYAVRGVASEVLPETRAHSTKEKILQAIQELGRATVDEVFEHLRENGEHVSKRTVYNHLDALYSGGLVEREGSRGRGGGYAFYCNSVIVQPLKDLHNCTIAQEQLALEPDPAPDPATDATGLPALDEFVYSTLCAMGEPDHRQLVDALKPHGVDAYALLGALERLQSAGRVERIPDYPLARYRALDAVGEPAAPEHNTQHDCGAVQPPAQLTQQEV